MREYMPIFVIVIVILAGVFYLHFFSPLSDVTLETARQTIEDKASKNYPKFKEIVKPSGYINTEDITIGELVGKKVVLVDFMTYSCINCIRTFPYLNDWYSEYKDQGLEIIGIHTPEFTFEKDYNNVVEAMRKHNIEFPVVLDNDYGTWRAYGNNFWPRKYLIDIDGNIVYDHIGEGKYTETERKIQELLKERMERLNEEGEIVGSLDRPADAEAVDLRSRRSPEIYFGSARNEWLGNGTLSRVKQAFSLPNNFDRDTIYLEGDWSFTNEYAENHSSDAKIVFRYKAEKVFFVASADEPVRVRILRDGQEVGEAGGEDVVNGVVTIREDRLYRLIAEPDGNSEHVIEIIPESPGLKAFTFTFG